MKKNPEARTQNPEEEARSQKPEPRRSQNPEEARSENLKFGFTLLEILIVVVIIGILASLVLVGVTYAIRTSKISNTQAMLRTMQGVLDNYQTRWRNYPPSTLAGTPGVRLPNNINNGIESLVASLSSRREGGIMYRPSDQSMYVNTDADELTKNPTESYLTDSGAYPLLEYSDYFGNVVMYLHHKDYTRAPAEVTTYKVTPEGSEKGFKPSKGPGNAWAMPDQYQLVSPGPDHEPGTDDDIRPF